MGYILARAKLLVKLRLSFWLLHSLPSMAIIS